MKIKQKVKNYLGEERFFRVKRFVFRFIHIFSVRKKTDGTGNVFRFQNAFLKRVVFDVSGDHNTVQIGKNSVLLNSRIIIRGDHHTLRIGQDCFFQGVEFRFEDSGCLIETGNGLLIVDGVRLSAVEPGKKIRIGDRTIIGEETDIRTTDAHSIIDLKTGKRINPGADITIGKRVWIAKDVNILKGVTIGDDTVIGIRSLLTRNVPSNAIAAGVPAKVINTGIRWEWDRIDEPA